MKIPPIAIIGSGSWGTALAIHLARLQQPIRLWGRDDAHLKQMALQRENRRYLPDVRFPPAIQILPELSNTLNQVRDIVIAVPSHGFRQTLLTLKPLLKPETRLISAAKGIDPQTHELLHQVANEVLGENIPIAVLSGPTFAKEVAIGLPTAVTIASESNRFAQDVVKLFHSKHFRVYQSQDIVGVQLGGAIKNILAIAAGIADGLQCGANAIAALLTRGLAEMTRLGIALGGMPETFTGLAGLGDLILTCTNNQSRNRRFGLALGQGENLKTAEKNIGQVVEGIQAANEIYQLAQTYQIDMPITEQIYRVLYRQLTPIQALNNLLEREPRVE